MPLFRLGEKQPQLGENAIVAPTPTSRSQQVPREKGANIVLDESRWVQWTERLNALADWLDCNEKATPKH